MPRYDEVYIPGKSAAQFESMVRSLGGTVGKAAHTRGEIVDIFTPQWHSELIQARGLLEKFQQTQSPEANMRIFQGMTRLLGSVLPVDEIRADINWQEARTALARIFEKFLVEDIPQGVSIRKKEHASYFTRPKTASLSTLIMPKDITYVLLHYGLTGEEPKTIEELATENGLSAAIVSERISHSRNAIARSAEKFWS